MMDENGEAEIKIESESEETSLAREQVKRKNKTAVDLEYRFLFQESIPNRKSFVCLVVGDLQGGAIPCVLSLSSDHYKADWEYDGK